MYTLVFDTTTNFCMIGLLDDHKLICQFEKQMDFGQAETLIVQIKNILQEQKLSFSDIKLGVVCTGPGSFTGVRSSIAAARAFAIAWPDMRVCGVNAFDVYLKELNDEELADYNAVLIETKRDDFYWCCFDAHRKKIIEPTAAYYEDILGFLRAKNVAMIGDGVERFLNKPSALKLKTVKLCAKPSLAALAQVGLTKFSDAKTDFPKPMYLKAPDVCVK